MKKINKKSKEGINRKIAFFSMIALLLNVAMAGVFAPSGNVLNAGDNQQMCQAAIDVVMIMDRSGSMGYDGTCYFNGVKYKEIISGTSCYKEGLEKGYEISEILFVPSDPTKLSQAQTAANLFLNNLGTDDQSALISYADEATLDKGLSNNHTDSNDPLSTEAYVNALFPWGGTNIGDAIYFSNQELESNANPQAVKVAILLTDGMANKPNGPGYGEDQDDVDYAIEKAEEAANAGYKIFTIGLGSNINEAMLSNIASLTGAQKEDGSPGYYHAPSSGELEGIYTEISQQLCEYGSISGCKYEDTNNNGNMDDEVITISDWEIILSGHSNTTQLTDENGCYQFSGLLPGTYAVNEGGKDGVDNFEQTYPANGLYSNIILPEGSNLENYDFGNYLPYCGNEILDENYFSYNEECDGQTGVGDHQSCSDECILIDLTYCGDGIKQMPNGEGIGGPQNDGYEECDGQEGIDSGQVCLVNCVIEEDDPVCQETILRECVADGEAEVFYEYYPVGCDDDHTETEVDSDCACVETEVVGECVDEANREFTYTYNYDYCEVKDSEIREDETCEEEQIYQCSDGIDNDSDQLIDNEDPGCHTDGDVNNENSYDAEDDDEYNEPEPYCGDGTCNNNETCSTCPQDCGSCGGGGGVIVKPTIIITNEKVVYSGNGEALVTWTTNIETTRQVVYGDNSITTLGVVPEYGYDSVNGESTDMTKEHSVTIAGLTDGTPYYFRPVADRNGSTGEVVGVEVYYEPGEVKGIEAPAPTPPPVECNYLLEYIKLGADNNPVEVEKLERFLNEFEGENLAVNGIYEQIDFDAVSRFQEKYLADVLSPWSHNKATGYVYITTKKKINELYCQREFPLTAEQEAEVALFSERVLDIFTESGSAEASDDSGEDLALEDTSESSDVGDEEDVSGRVGGAEDEADETENENKDEAAEDKDEAEIETETETTETEDESEITIQDIQEEDADESEYASDRYSKYLPAFLIIIIIIGSVWYFLSGKKGKEETN